MHIYLGKKRQHTDFKEILYVVVVPEEQKNVPFYEKNGFAVMDDTVPLRIKNDTWE